jgi:hypothetical protein
LPSALELRVHSTGKLSIDMRPFVPLDSPSQFLSVNRLPKSQA